MATVYITHAELSAFLRWPTGGFDADTNPSSDSADDIINRAEGLVDLKTNHSWQTKTITDEYYDYDGTGLLKLRHDNIYTLTDEIDKMEVYEHVTDNTYTDFVDEDTGYTATRGSDFWVDYTRGIIYFGNQEPKRGFRRIRMTYRYYTQTVPQHIKLATTYYAGALLLDTEDFQPILPTGAGVEQVSFDGKSSRWREMADEICEKEYRPAHVQLDTKLHRGDYYRGRRE